MSENYLIKISVRELVEFVLRSGDLRHVPMHKDRLKDAITAHTLLQEQSPEGYMPEVTLKYTFVTHNLHLQVQGRADGIYVDEKKIFIDEIKTTYIPGTELQENPVHWAQAKMYAFIYATENQIAQIDVRLTYFHMETKEKHYFYKTFTIEDLRLFVDEIVNLYFGWVRKKIEWLEKRQLSTSELVFPFDSMRIGQQQLVEAVEDSLNANVKLFAQAPTGIGKTVATLYPALKNIRDKIFYLTAKNTGHQIPLQSLDKMREKGLRCKSIVITAKDKVCMCEAKDINECEFTVGYFDRINEAIEDIFEHDNWDAEVIVDYAKKHRLCPYEFSLELSLWADCIVCDYNYAFDPRVYLRRFFLDSKGKYFFLVDEAHNLIERARTMFSAHVEKKKVLEVRRSTKSRFAVISKKIYTINKKLLEMKKCGSEVVDDKTLQEFLEAVQETCSEIDQHIAQKKELPPEVMDFYFSLNMFMRVAGEFLDDNYRIHFDVKKGDLYLWCIDPSRLLQKSFAKAQSSILFSATLIPQGYCENLLGREPEDQSLQLSSPFPLENFGLFVATNIDTSFHKRHLSYEQIADYIAITASSKIGNYLVFFPSYAYLSDVLKVFNLKHPEMKTLEQHRDMTNDDRQKFLENFIPNDKEILVGFVVLGGIFSEGIDLVGDRVLGVVNIGVGLPQVGTKRNLIRDYFNEQQQNGFAYAYAYPGMNRVMQAAGRVIRTEKDVGIVLLIGRRFQQPLYNKTTPSHWYPHSVYNQQHLATMLQSFWNYPR